MSLLSGLETVLLPECREPLHGDASVRLVETHGVRGGAVAGVAHGGEVIEGAVEEEEDAVVRGVCV